MALGGPFWSKLRAKAKGSPRFILGALSAHAPGRGPGGLCPPAGYRQGAGLPLGSASLGRAVLLPALRPSEGTQGRAHETLVEWTAERAAPVREGWWEAGSSRLGARSRSGALPWSGPPTAHPLPFAAQVCHHADCQQLHRRGPLNLCASCDSKFHSTMHYDGHVRFDLPPQGECGSGCPTRPGPAPGVPRVALDPLSGGSVSW